MIAPSADRLGRRVLGALLLLCVGACTHRANGFTQRGTFGAGTLAVQNAIGNVYAYPPAPGEPAAQYTVTATPVVNRLARSTLSLNRGAKLLIVRADRFSALDYLVRVPKGVRAHLETRSGDIHASDVSGPVDAITGTGSIRIQVPGYATAHSGTGNVFVTFGDAHWPGTLAFSAVRGDVEVYVPALADARVDLHTDNGTIFTDFNLRGAARGKSESIVGILGHGGNRSVVVRVHNGSIRLLRLVPQM